MNDERHAASRVARGVQNVLDANLISVDGISVAEGGTEVVIHLRGPEDIPDGVMADIRDLLDRDGCSLTVLRD